MIAASVAMDDRSREHRRRLTIVVAELHANAPDGFCIAVHDPLLRDLRDRGWWAIQMTGAGLAVDFPGPWVTRSQLVERWVSFVAGGWHRARVVGNGVVVVTGELDAAPGVCAGCRRPFREHTDEQLCSCAGRFAPTEPR